MKALPECKPTLTVFIQRKRSKIKIREKLRETPKMGIRKTPEPLGDSSVSYGMVGQSGYIYYIT